MKKMNINKRDELKKLYAEIGKYTFSYRNGDYMEEVKMIKSLYTEITNQTQIYF